MILDADLRKRRIRDRGPMTFVTSGPDIGDMGLGGVGDSKGLLEAELWQRHIKWITNAKRWRPKVGVRVAEHETRRAGNRARPAVPLHHVHPAVQRCGCGGGGGRSGGIPAASC